MSRRAFLATCLALLLVAASGTTYVVLQHGRGSHPAHNSATATEPPRADVLAALDGLPASRPSVAAALAPLVRSAAFGGALAGLVVDAKTGAVVWQRGAGQAVPPASTAKLLTATALLSTLPVTTTLTTRVQRVGRTLVLVGGGDPTLALHSKATGSFVPASLRQLARLTVQAVAGQPGPWRLRYDTSRWPVAGIAPGWTAGYISGGDIAPIRPLEVDAGTLRPGTTLRSSDPPRLAATDFRALLRRDGLDVPTAPVAGVAQVSAATVAAVHSPPLPALVERMLTLSDNDLAEALGRTLALARGEPATFTGEAAAILAAVHRLGLPLTGVQLFDATGLSRLDRVTPRFLVALLRRTAGDPRFAPLFAGLAIAGATGTLALRYRHGHVAQAAGAVRAKTGTLSGVNALAGQVVNASRRLLFFAFICDHAPVPTATEQALDRLAAALAQQHT